MLNLAQWRSQGKHWEEMPQVVKRIGEEALEIPELFKLTLLPSSDLSINGMLDFILPNSAPGLHPQDTQQYFSQEGAGHLTSMSIISLH